MHDQTAMREVHRLRHLLEELHPGTHGKTVRGGEDVDGSAVDELHRQIWAPLGRDPGVVESRNVPVLERGKRVALLLETLGDSSGPAIARQLEGNLALQRTVSAFGQPHSPHAAAAEFAHQAVRADVLADLKA